VVIVTVFCGRNPQWPFYTKHEFNKCNRNPNDEGYPTAERARIVCNGDEGCFGFTDKHCNGIRDGSDFFLCLDGDSFQNSSSSCVHRKDQPGECRSLECCWGEKTDDPDWMDLWVDAESCGIDHPDPHPACCQDEWISSAEFCLERHGGWYETRASTRTSRMKRCVPHPTSPPTSPPPTTSPNWTAFRQKSCSANPLQGTPIQSFPRASDALEACKDDPECYGYQDRDCDGVFQKNGDDFFLCGHPDTWSISRRSCIYSNDDSSLLEEILTANTQSYDKKKRKATNRRNNRN
jgi:hypothetical protein